MYLLKIKPFTLLTLVILGLALFESSSLEIGLDNTYDVNETALMHNSLLELFVIWTWNDTSNYHIPFIMDSLVCVCGVRVCVRCFERVITILEIAKEKLLAQRCQANKVTNPNFKSLPRLHWNWVLNVLLHVSVLPQSFWW